MDTDVVLVLRGGREISVVYPTRIGKEMDAQWLDSPGCREWNIDVLDSYAHPPPFQCHPRFVVGKWGTDYGESKGVEGVIPYEELVCVKQLSPEDQARSDDFRLKENAERARALADARPIRSVEFVALESRVRKLEDRLEAIAPEAMHDLKRSMGEK